MDYLLSGFLRAIQLLLSGDAETYSAVTATLTVSSLSIFISLLAGIPAGFFLGYKDFPGRKQIRAVFDTLLALPTVVVGLLVYSFVSRRGLLGDFGLLFTIPGIVTAQIILITPIVVSLTASAVESLDSRVGITLKTLGAGSLRTAFASIHEARYAVLTAAVTAYGRAISEVGASMMIGGNIKWHTRTITTAIALETGKGDFAMAMALGLVLLFFAFLVNGSLILFKRKS